MWCLMMSNIITVLYVIVTAGVSAEILPPGTMVELLIARTSLVSSWLLTDGWELVVSREPSYRLSIHVTQPSDADWDDLWEQFDERRYLNAKKWRVGDDPYKLYAFNQRESERISSNRAVPDTRHKRYFLLLLLCWYLTPLCGQDRSAQA